MNSDLRQLGFQRLDDPVALGVDSCRVGLVIGIDAVMLCSSVFAHGHEAFGVWLIRFAT
ncbi:hypothetical protein GCM10020260_11890 [Nesterenkonia halobia]|uniref:Uncharacterized protein n=1 Tax=Nesterenkonia halobia TaxID=37922 RepID=A0ABP6RD91_9MICC